jgi:glutathione S-transferase
MLKLHDREASGNAYKVRLLLSLLGVPYERIPVAMKDGRNQVDSGYLALNPRGQIPTLQDGELTLWGSTAILCYIASRYDKSGSWLPRDPAQLGQVMQWLELAQNEIQSGLFRARAITRFGIDGDLPTAQQQAIRALQVLESRLDKGQWLAGKGPTIADIACFPYVALAAEGNIDTSQYPNVQRWIARIKSVRRHARHLNFFSPQHQDTARGYSTRGHAWRRRRRHPGRRRRYVWRQGLIGYRARLPVDTTGNRHLMTLGIHALYVACVIAALQAVSRGLRCFGAGQATDQKTRACTHGGAFLPTDRRAGSCAHHRTDHGAFHSAILGSLAGCYATDAREGVVPALHVVGAKVVKALVRAGQHHHAGAARHGSAGSHEQGHGEY